MKKILLLAILLISIHSFSQNGLEYPGGWGTSPKATFTSLSEPKEDTLVSYEWVDYSPDGTYVQVGRVHGEISVNDTTYPEEVRGVVKYMSKMSPSGDVIWERGINVKSDNDKIHFVDNLQIDEEGNIYYVTPFESSIRTKGVHWKEERGHWAVMKLSPEGDVLWINSVHELLDIDRDDVRDYSDYCLSLVEDKAFIWGHDSTQTVHWGEISESGDLIEKHSMSGFVEAWGGRFVVAGDNYLAVIEGAFDQDSLVVDGEEFVLDSFDYEATEVYNSTIVVRFNKAFEPIEGKFLTKRSYTLPNQIMLLENGQLGLLMGVLNYKGNDTVIIDGAEYPLEEGLFNNKTALCTIDTASLKVNWIHFLPADEFGVEIMDTDENSNIYLSEKFLGRGLELDSGYVINETSGSYVFKFDSEGNMKWIKPILSTYGMVTDIAVQGNGAMRAVAMARKSYVMWNNHKQYTSKEGFWVEFGVLSGREQSLVLKEQKILTYPNPSFETVNIQVEENIENIEVFDSFGQLVEVHFYYQGTSARGNIARLKPGVYFARVRSGNGMQLSRFVRR